MERITIHALRELIKKVNRTHKGLGALVAINLLAAKAKICLLNVSPSGCGKSILSMWAILSLSRRHYLYTPIKSQATDTIHAILVGDTYKYTSLTLAGLRHIMKKLTQFAGHLIIDDLGGEKSLWSRISTITVLANLVYGHYVDKITHSGRITIENFEGSAALNIQPIMMNSLVASDEWIAVVRDKVLRYYHLIRPLNPKKAMPDVQAIWGIPIRKVSMPRYLGKLYQQLIVVGLCQWSYGRCLEHIPSLLRACAAIDERTKVGRIDYTLLYKLLKPMQLERYILTTYGFETGRVFQNNTYCILVELASHGEPAIGTICEDYKVSPTTVDRLVEQSKEWAWIKKNSPRRLMPTPQAQDILNLCGIGQKW